MTGVATRAPGGLSSDGVSLPEMKRPGYLARHPAWPVSALLIGYPLWWALGLADFTWIFLAIPMAVRMLAWRVYGRKLKLPPGFGIWLVFLVCAAAGIAVLTLKAPGTVPSPVSHRVISYGDRTLNYVGVTVMLIYAGNLTERELPRRRFAWMLGFVGVCTVLGGLAGMLKPDLQFSSPFLLMLPHSVQSNPFIQASMHPGLSQVQNVLGSAAGRPKAPYDYTNIWGDCLTILVPWLFVSWRTMSRRRRLAALAIAVVAIAPLLYSLNRMAWIGAVLAAVYLAVRFAARGRTAMLGGLFVGVALVVVLVLVTPLQSVISGRLANGKSDNLRSNLSALTIKDAIASPIIGYGDTRQEAGSASSIAIGPSPKCPVCGQQAVGSTGQLWLLLVCSGFLGTFFYLGFFAYSTWYFRHDASPIGVAGVLVLLLSFVYMFTYDAVGAPLGFTMLALGLLWKNGMARIAGEPDENAAPGPAEPSSPWRYSSALRRSVSGAGRTSPAGDVG